MSYFLRVSTLGCVVVRGSDEALDKAIKEAARKNMSMEEEGGMGSSGNEDGQQKKKWKIRTRTRRRHAKSGKRRLRWVRKQGEQCHGGEKKSN